MSLSLALPLRLSLPIQVSFRRMISPHNLCLIFRNHFLPNFPTNPCTYPYPHHFKGDQDRAERAEENTTGASPHFVSICLHYSCSQRLPPLSPSSFITFRPPPPSQTHLRHQLCTTIAFGSANNPTESPFSTSESARLHNHQQQPSPF